MTKARRLGVYTPVLYSVDPLLHTLTFEYVEGSSVKDIFLEFGLHGVSEKRLDDIAMQIGDTMGKLHDGGLIHGDLTTSNMLIRGGTNQLVSHYIFSSFSIYSESYFTSSGSVTLHLCFSREEGIWKRKRDSGHSCYALFIYIL